MIDTTAMIKLSHGHTECVIRHLKSNGIQHEVKQEVLFIYADYAEQYIEIGMFIQKLRHGEIRNTG